MKKINNKGFSLVELLAVITILGILAGGAIVAYSKYKAKAKVQAYDTLAKSSMQAMEEYMMDHPNTTDPVTINTLYYEQYLERPTDASSSENECVGNVTAEHVPAPITDKKLDTYKYTINICCANYEYQYEYTPGNDEMPKKKMTETDTPTACSSIKTTTEAEKATQETP